MYNYTVFVYTRMIVHDNCNMLYENNASPLATSSRQSSAVYAKRAHRTPEVDFDPFLHARPRLPR